MRVFKRVSGLFALLILVAVTGSAQSSPEAVIKAFYNGYIRSTGKGVNPFGKRSTLKKHLTARLIKEQVTAHEANQDADYFLQSQKYHSEWENNFNISEPVVKGATATAFVTFPDDHSQVKITLRKTVGVWKIDRVENAPLAAVSAAAGRVAKDNEYKFLIGTETPAFRDGSDAEKCFVFREYVVKTTPRQESGKNVAVYKREASAIVERACKETGSSHLGTESDVGQPSSDFSFFGLSGSLLFLTKDSISEPYRDLEIYDLDTREGLTEATYTGEPKLVDGRFVVFDSNSDKSGDEKICYAKWVIEDLSITWVQGKKLDLQTLKVSNVGKLRCLAYRLRISDR